MSIRVVEYIQEDGFSPYAEWFDDLDVQAAAKVSSAKARMATGITSSIKWFDGIGEYRIDWGPGYRIYLAKDGDKLIVLFGGGTKKQQDKDIAKALILHSEYKARKKAQAKPRPSTQKLR